MVFRQITGYCNPITFRYIIMSTAGEHMNEQVYEFYNACLMVVSLCAANEVQAKEMIEQSHPTVAYDDILAKPATPLPSF